MRRPRSRVRLGRHLSACVLSRRLACWATFVAVAGTVSVGTASGLGSAATSRHPGAIGLLPDPAAAGQVWDWSASCPLGPQAGGRCQGAGPVLGRAQLNGDEWNLGVTDPPIGQVQTTMAGAGTLTVQGDLPLAPPCTVATCLAPAANTWVRGYVNVAYGDNPCRAQTSPAGAATLRLPIRVNALPRDVVGTTSYSSLTGQATFDIAYDMWLNPSGTSTPCRAQGTVEVMLWTDYDEQALLPPSTEVGVATIPYAVGHVPKSGADAWSVYAVNVYRSGRTAPFGGSVFLVLDAQHVVPSGTVSVDVNKALSAVGRLLRLEYGWRDFVGRYWLDTIPFGMEFGPADAQPWGDGPAAFTLELRTYCLGLRATVAHPRC